MAKLAGAWATVQGVLGLATLLWAALIFWYPAPTGLPTHAFPRDIFFPGATAAAGIFFLAAAILYGRSHPDARIVGVFGLGIFAITNVALVWDRWTACADGTHGCGLQGNWFNTPVQDPHVSAFQGPALDALVAMTVMVTVVQAVLLWTGILYTRRQAAQADRARLEADAGAAGRF